MTGWAVSAAIAVILLVAYVTWTAGRLDRMHARVDAAWAALDAQLVRRAAAARALAPLLPDGPDRARLERAAAQALAATGDDRREAVENALSLALHDALGGLPEPVDAAELRTAATRVALARSFHNAAVKDTRSLRFRRVPRLLRLAGHRAMPGYFEIDDTVLAG